LTPAARLEVWFDQSEHRGGDAWDAAIRKQVKECALFVALVSANTDARSEVYFRRECTNGFASTAAENSEQFVGGLPGERNAGSKACASSSWKWWPQ
jgi:hypothetical protein